MNQRVCLAGEPLLRPATVADAGDLAEIQFEARRQAMPWLVEPFTYPEILWTFRNVTIRTMNVFVVTEAERPVAFVAEQRGWIDHLYVHPDHWRRGHGTRLLRAVQAQHEELQLWTFKGNRAARAFYARNGFATVEITDGARNAEKEADMRLVWRRDGRIGRTAPLTAAA